MSGLFNILICGIQKNVDAAKVKTKFSTMFRLEATQVERVFNAAPIILRRNIPEDFADSLVKRLSAIGVLVQKVNADPKAPIASPAISKAIIVKDQGETASDASAMHQPVDFFYNDYERRIPFLFSGRGLSYGKLWSLNLLVCVLSAGLLYPWAKYRSVSYLCQHLSFDNKNFYCVENTKSIYFIHSALMIFLISILVSLLYSLVYFAVLLFILIIAFPYYRFKCNELKSGRILYCGTSLSPALSLKDTYLNILVWPALIFLTAGFIMPLAIFNIHSTKFKGTYIGDYAITFSAEPRQYWMSMSPLIIAELAIGFLLYWRQEIPSILVVCSTVTFCFLAFIYWRVTVEKLHWSNVGSALGYFVSSWTLIGYGMLVLKNILLCLITLGLYCPWARINHINYKASHLAFFANQRYSKWSKKCFNFQAGHEKSPQKIGMK